MSTGRGVACTQRSERHVTATAHAVIEWLVRHFLFIYLLKICVSLQVFTKTTPHPPHLSELVFAFRDGCLLLVMVQYCKRSQRLLNDNLVNCLLLGLCIYMTRGVRRCSVWSFSKVPCTRLDGNGFNTWKLLNKGSINSLILARGLKPVLWRAFHAQGILCWGKRESVRWEAQRYFRRWGWQPEEKDTSVLMFYARWKFLPHPHTVEDTSTFRCLQCFA